MNETKPGIEHRDAAGAHAGEEGTSSREEELWLARDELARQPACGSALTRRQRRLLAALLTEVNTQAAARVAGVARRTAYYWLRDEAFRNELTRQREGLLGDALDAVKVHAGRAVLMMGRLMGGKDPHMARLICNDLLVHAMKIRKTGEFERRLVEVERNQKALLRMGAGKQE